MKQINKIITAIFIFIISGCSTISGNHTPQTVYITVHENGQCTVQNKTVPIAKIAKAVKSTGANKNTRISITIPKDIDNVDTKKIINNLAVEGYIKIYFHTPREAISYVNKK